MFWTSDRASKFKQRASCCMRRCHLNILTYYESHLLLSIHSHFLFTWIPSRSLALEWNIVISKGFDLINPHYRNLILNRWISWEWTVNHSYVVYYSPHSQHQYIIAKFYLVFYSLRSSSKLIESFYFLLSYLVFSVHWYTLEIVDLSIVLFKSLKKNHTFL